MNRKLVWDEDSKEVFNAKQKQCITENRMRKREKKNKDIMNDSNSDIEFNALKVDPKLK